jgi:hypothetical protein
MASLMPAAGLLVLVIFAGRFKQIPLQVSS